MDVTASAALDAIARPSYKSRVDDLQAIKRRIERGEDVTALLEELGTTRRVLDKRLTRTFGETVRSLQTGELRGPGRPPASDNRTQFNVRLSHDERLIVEAAISLQLAGGDELTTKGAHLIAALRLSPGVEAQALRLRRRRPRKSQAKGRSW